MHEIHKKIVTDENARPIAVQIDYADWLEIERRLGSKESSADSGVSPPKRSLEGFSPVKIKGGPISEDIVRDRR